MDIGQPKRIIEAPEPLPIDPIPFDPAEPIPYEPVEVPEEVEVPA